MGRASAPIPGVEGIGVLEHLLGAVGAEREAALALFWRAGVVGVPLAGLEAQLKPDGVAKVLATLLTALRLWRFQRNKVEIGERFTRLHLVGKLDSDPADAS